MFDPKINGNMFVSRPANSEVLSGEAVCPSGWGGGLFLLVLGPLILSGLIALAIAVACSVVVMLIQRIFGFF